MFSYFFPAAKTRLETTKELTDLLPLLTELQQKEASLKALVAGNVSHSAYAKSLVMTSLVLQINRAIDEFNKAPVPDSVATEIIFIISLVKNLKGALANTLDKHGAILNEPRSGTKETLKSTIEASTFVASIGVGVATGSILYGGASLLAIAPRVDKGIKDITGLSDSRTASMRILESLRNKLNYMDGVLNFLVSDLMADEQLKSFNSLICPITQDRMKHPVLCLLDNRMYEKAAIEKWLMEKGTSPFNRKSLAEGQTVAAVLIENFSLRDALEELEKLQLEKAAVGEENKEEESKEEKKSPKA